MRISDWSSDVCSSDLASLMWLTLFNPSIGVVNQLLQELGRDPVRWLQDKDTALAAVSVTTVWQNLGITFIIISAGLQSLPDDQIGRASCRERVCQYV